VSAETTLYAAILHNFHTPTMTITTINTLWYRRSYKRNEWQQNGPDWCRAPEE